MANGVYRNKVRDGTLYAGVDYGDGPKEIAKAKYEMRGFKPSFDELPTKEEYMAAKLKIAAIPPDRGT